MDDCPVPSEKFRVPKLIILTPGLGFGIEPTPVKVKVSEPGKFVNLNSEALTSVEFVLATLAPDKFRGLLVTFKDAPVKV